MLSYLQGWRVCRGLQGLQGLHGLRRVGLWQVGDKLEGKRREYGLMRWLSTLEHSNMQRRFWPSVTRWCLMLGSSSFCRAKLLLPLCSHHLLQGGCVQHWGTTQEVGSCVTTNQTGSLFHHMVIEHTETEMCVRQCLQRDFLTQSVLMDSALASRIPVHTLTHHIWLDTGKYCVPISKHSCSDFLGSMMPWCWPSTDAVFYWFPCLDVSSLGLYSTAIV